MVLCVPLWKRALTVEDGRDSALVRAQVVNLVGLLAHFFLKSWDWWELRSLERPVPADRFATAATTADSERKSNSSGEKPAQGFENLDAATELVHTFLRILEGYSKQNVDLQVRSRKRARRKKKEDKGAYHRAVLSDLKNAKNDLKMAKKYLDDTKKELENEINIIAAALVVALNKAQLDIHVKRD
ncbi:hypothetical protein B0H65DRAFT_144301 [Neurospora tetraspora]|uniref:Uncharacterized protein n=1 Tax=Neurospora tetraspora TaxID=94610 RepID=A0AAE0JM50_9PEZI|nr:hypothetical protein B0H65DRAFT_144301 [Neurospora tetraspora]